MQTSGKQSGPPVDGNERRDDVLTSLERVWPGSMRLHVASGDCRRLEERRKVVSTASSPSVDKKRRKYLQHSKSGLVSTSQSRILSCPSRLLDVKVQENSIKSDYETLGTIRMLRKKNVRVSHWWWPCNSSFSMIVFFFQTSKWTRNKGTDRCAWKWQRRNRRSSDWSSGSRAQVISLQ